MTTNGYWPNERFYWAQTDFRYWPAGFRYWPEAALIVVTRGCAVGAVSLVGGAVGAVEGC